MNKIESYDLEKLIKLIKKIFISKNELEAILKNKLVIKSDYLGENSIHNNKDWWALEIRIGNKKEDIKEFCVVLVNQNKKQIDL